MKLILLAILTFYNCVSSTGGISTSNVPIINRTYKVVSPVEEKVRWVSLDFALIGFPIQKPPVSNLIKEILEKNKADALINIHYWNDKSIFLFLTIHSFGLNAEAIKFDEINETKKSR